MAAGAFRELRMACLLSRKACADYLGVSLRTVRYWDAGRHRVPWAVVRLLRLLRCGDLGGVDDAWQGFRLLRGVLYTPDGRGFPVDALRCWWQMVEQARFWRDAYDQRERARGAAQTTVGSPQRLPSPLPSDGDALDLVPPTGRQVRAVHGQPAPRQDTTTPPRRLLLMGLRMDAPPHPTPDATDTPIQGEQPAELPRRASAAPAAGLHAPRSASRYARRRWAARSDAGLVSFLKQVIRDGEKVSVSAASGRCAHGPCA